jgi:hypothetical protein
LRLEPLGLIWLRHFSSVLRISTQGIASASA